MCPFLRGFLVKKISVDTLSYKTVFANKSTVDKKWWIVDADSQILGRLSSEVAKVLRGKHKPSYSPHVDCGDNVIIINSEKIALTGNKWKEKEYISHSGYPGGQRTITAEQLREKDARKVVEKAVKGMLPKNRLGREIFRNLYVYEGTEHPHEAQKPKELKF